MSSSLCSVLSDVSVALLKNLQKYKLDSVKIVSYYSNVDSVKIERIMELKKRTGTGMYLVLMVLIIVIVFLFLVWWCISGNRIREYKDEKCSISSKEKIEINGVLNGMFINGRDTANPILLLVSSGPGTDDYFLTERFSDMHIDDIFTVVYWDYRGMGIVYDSEINPEEITQEVLLEDTKAVSEYLMKRFDKDKIYIMGFSGGSRIAINAVKKYPELYYAYIGMAQVVTDSSQRDRLMYDFMKSVFEERKDKKSLKKLEQSVRYEDGKPCCNDWEKYVMLLHKAGGGTTYNETEFVGVDLPIIMAHCYTISEKIGYIRGLKMYRKTAFEVNGKGFDYRESLREFEIPVYFVSGNYDYNCPYPLVEDYCNKITAPDKKFYVIDHAAHSPLWENAKDSFEVFCEIRKRTYHEE